MIFPMHAVQGIASSSAGTLHTCVFLLVLVGLAPIVDAVKLAPHGIAVEYEGRGR